MTDGLRQGLSVAQRAQARLRLGDDWQLVVAGAVLGVVVAFAALAFILPLHAAERALERVLHGSRDAATLFAACAPAGTG